MVRSRVVSEIIKYGIISNIECFSFIVLSVFSKFGGISMKKVYNFFNDVVVNFLIAYSVKQLTQIEAIEQLLA